MKNLKQPLFIIGIVTLFLSLSSCGNSRNATKARQKSSTEGWDYGSGGVQRMEDGVPDKYFDNAADKKVQEKKVIFNGSVAIAVENPDSTNYRLEALTKKYKGYVTELGSNKSIIRVKHYHMKAAMVEIESFGKVENKNVSGKDVTNDYLDYEIRLENAEKARSRYLTLLEKAENVEAALLVEKELERLNGTIDMLKGRMSRIDHLSEFSTITVYLRERKKPGILGYIGLGLYHSVKWLFVRN